MLFSLPDFTFLQGTISDQTGAFNIKSNETKGVLPISSVGYSTILLPCTSSNMGTIQLYSDDYSKIYQSVDAYMSNITKLQEKIKKSTGYNATITRSQG